MTPSWKRNRIERIAEAAKEYVGETYSLFPWKEELKEKPHTHSVGNNSPRPQIRLPHVNGGQDSGEIKYSLRDGYSSQEINDALREFSGTGVPGRTLQTLDRFTNMSFVDKMIDVMAQRGWHNAHVYKAAQIDRRLFSKIISDRFYQPSKDTAISLCFALKLSLEEANDLLGRAGFILSHSSKRDVILEYCFQEKIYNLDIVNGVLFSLEQKLLGRM